MKFSCNNLCYRIKMLDLRFLSLKHVISFDKFCHFVFNSKSKSSRSNIDTRVINCNNNWLKSKYFKHGGNYRYRSRVRSGYKCIRKFYGKPSWKWQFENLLSQVHQSESKTVINFISRPIVDNFIDKMKPLALTASDNLSFTTHKTVWNVMCQ